MTSSSWQESFKTSLQQSLVNGEGELAAQFVFRTLKAQKKGAPRHAIDKIVFEVLMQLVRTEMLGGQYENYPRATDSNKELHGVYPYPANYRTPLSNDNLLHYAVRAQSLGVVQYLVAQHPELIEEPNASQDTPLHDAVSRNVGVNDTAALNIFTLLCEKSEETAFGRMNLERKTPLCVALSSSSPEIFKPLLQKYVNLKETPYGLLNTSPFHYAARNPEHAVHACEELLSVVYPSWGSQDVSMGYRIFGDLHSMNIEGETPLDLLAKQAVPTHQILGLVDKEVRVNIQRGSIVKVSKKYDLPLLHEYLQAVATNNYVALAGLIIELAMKKDNRLYALAVMQHNIFSMIAQDRTASAELPRLFSELPGMAHQLFEFQVTPSSLNKAAIVEIYRLRSNDKDLPVAIAFHGVIDSEELAELRGYSSDIHDINDLFDYLKTEASLSTVPSNSSLRNKVVAYENALEAAFSTMSSPLSSVYNEEEVAQLADMDIDNAEELVDFLNNPLSFKIFDGQHPIRVKGRNFVESVRINVASGNALGISSTNAVELFANREDDSRLYLQLKAQGATSASQVQEFLQNVQDDDEHAMHPVREHLKNMRANPREHLVVTAESIKNKLFDFEQFRKEESQKLIAACKKSFAAQSERYLRAVNSGDFIDAFTSIYLSPSLTLLPTNSNNDNIYHQLVKAEMNTPALLEFFTLPLSRQALTEQNIEGRTPLEVAELSENERVLQALNLFLNYNMNNVRLSYALDNGASLQQKTMESAELQRIVANFILNPQRTQRFMDYAYLCSIYGKPDESSSSSSIGCLMHDNASASFNADTDALSYLAEKNFAGYRKLVETQGRNKVFGEHNTDGENAAHIAAKTLDVEAIRLLSDLGFKDFSAISLNGDRPLTIANRMITKDNRKNFEQFVQASKEAQQLARQASSSSSSSSSQ
ncbi:MAG: hypothetical protein BVN35_06065 [Proteobacteria bacterium ST_bin11]|nr:MAG: hypothetical protein BVN35_06065 [Proteobacteria bacterium ST_bin11]